MNRLGAAFAALAVSLTCGPGVAAAQEAAAPAADGAALYRTHCRKCHGARGAPTARMLELYPKLKSLVDSTVMAHVTADTVVALITKGRGDMKPLADKMTAAEMQAVAQYVLTLRGAGGS
jgi:mono/diheme cytochrome c family protein